MDGHQRFIRDGRFGRRGAAAGETLALKELLYPCVLTWLCTFFDFCECLSCTILAPATLGKYTHHRGFSESSAMRRSGEKGRGGENNAVGFAVINFKCAAHLFSSGFKGNEGSLRGFSYHICVFPEAGMERHLSFHLRVWPVWRRGALSAAQTHAENDVLSRGRGEKDVKKLLFLPTLSRWS